jgi:hypothetical protein
MSNFRGSLLLSFVSNGDLTEERLYSFSSLPNGWHYGRGCAPSPHTIVRALIVIHAMRGLGARKVEVFPAVDGSVVVSAYGQDTCVEITVAASGEFDYAVDLNDNEIAADEKISFASLVNAVKDSQWLKTTSSDSCIPNIIARRTDGFPQRHFGTTTKPEYQLFVNAA